MPRLAPRHERLTVRVWITRETCTGRRTERRTRLPRHATITRACDGCIRLGRMRDRVPLLGVLRTSAVIGASTPAGGTHERDGPTEASFPTPPREELRLPEDRDAFHRRDARDRRGRRSLTTRAGSPTHAARTAPEDPERCFGWALQGHGAVTRGSVSTGSTNAFLTRRKRAWN